MTQTKISMTINTMTVKITPKTTASTTTKTPKNKQLQANITSKQDRSRYDFLLNNIEFKNNLSSKACLWVQTNIDKMKYFTYLNDLQNSLGFRKGIDLFLQTKSDITLIFIQ